MREVAGFLGVDFHPVLGRPTVNRMPAGRRRPTAAVPRGPRRGRRAGRRALYRQLVSAAR